MHQMDDGLAKDNTIVNASSMDQTTKRAQQAYREMRPPLFLAIPLNNNEPQFWC